MFVFDASGTLLDVDAAAREAADEPGMEDWRDDWLSIARAWRERQLRYSSLYSMMQKYDDFWELTTRPLTATVEEHSLSSNQEGRGRLLSFKSELSKYAEVPSVLSDLKAAGHKLAVLSNTTPNMLKTPINTAGIAEVFDELLSVYILKCYKPTPSGYQLVTPRFNRERSDVSFFSSNNWDVSGSGAYGFTTIWVNHTDVTWNKLTSPPYKIVSTMVDGIWS